MSPTPVVPLDAFDLCVAALFLVLNAGASAAMRLGLTKNLVVAAARAVLQLTLLGLVLRWVFESQSLPVALGLMLFMALYAGFEAVQRTRHRVRGLVPLSMAVMAFSSISVAVFGLTAVVGVEPWYAPQYSIPIVGMILGNALTGVALGLETVVSGYYDGRERIEVLIAHGATPREASHDVVRRAVHTGLIPTFNMMIAAGVISIPGMMTGQILAGSPPSMAARYQIFILFSIAGAVALGVLGVSVLSPRLVFDDRGRLRSDRITVRSS